MAGLIYVDDVTVGESDEFADFTVWLDNPSTNTVTVRYATDVGTALTRPYAGGDDFQDTAGLLTFAPGETVKTVRVLLGDNTSQEPVENFVLDLTNPTNATLARTFALGTIIDNDAPSGTPVISISDLVVDEASREARFVISLDRPSVSNVSFSYATQDGSAVAGQDYATTSGTITLGPGEVARTITVPLINDTAPELNEVFSLVLSNLVNATSRDPVGTAVIAENDANPVSQPTILVDDITVGENQIYAEFIVRLNAPSTNTVTVRYATDVGTALTRPYAGGDDFQDTAGLLTFAPGETVKTVRVLLGDNTSQEPVENFVLDLTNPTNATLARTFALGTIIDNDAPSGTPVISISDLVVDEASREARFVISLDRPSVSNVSFSYATQDGSAVAGQDYATTSGTITLGPGEVARTITVPLINDTAPELNEVFSLVLSNLVNATSRDPVGTAVIAENDGNPTARPNLLAADSVITEGQTYAEFFVVLDAPSTNTVTVRYDTDVGTARTRPYADGDDFQDTAGLLTFAPGETVKMVRVLIGDNTTPEPTENYVLNLRNATNANLARSQGTGWIYDNDSNTSLPSSAADNVYELTNLADNITEAPGGGTDLVRAPFTYTLGDNVENLTLLGNGPFNAYGNALNNALTGNAGNNTLVGGPGNDTLDGGAGLDAAVFSGNRASYRIEKDGLQWVVTALSGNDGTDRLSNIETLVFADTSLTLIPPPRTSAPVYGQNNSFLFDPVYYLLTNPELIPTVGLAEAVTHYLNTGASQGERPNSWFDAAYYANRWDDLRSLNLDAATLFQHYNLFGVWEGRSAGPAFDTFNGNRYLAENPDVAGYVDAFIGDFLGSRTNGAIAHYIIYGANEGRAAHDATGAMIELGYIV